MRNYIKRGYYCRKMLLYRYPTKLHENNFIFCNCLEKKLQKYISYVPFRGPLSQEVYKFKA